MNPALATAVALAFLAAGCSPHTTDATQSARGSAASSDAVPITSLPLRRISVASSMELAGTLSAIQSADVGATVGGRVTAMGVRVGDVVRAGQTLVQIDDSQFRAQLSQAGAAVGVAAANSDATQAQVASANSQLLLAQQTAHRMDVLFNEGAISAEQHDQTQATLATARAAVRQYTSLSAAAQASAAQARTGVAAAAVPVGQTTVVAPFDGVITKKMVEAGTVVSAGSSLLQLQSTHDLELDVAMPERDAATVGIHTPVDVRVDALGGVSIPAWIRAIVPSENAALRSVTLKVAVAPRAGLLPGMFARVVLSGAGRTQWAVPMAAVVDRAGQTGVFVLSNDRARFMPVGTGATSGRYVAVTGVAGSTTRVATSGLELLTDGSRVEVRP